MATEEKKHTDQNDSKLTKFLKKQNIEISAKRYFIDAMGAMAQGLFASLLIGTIIATLGQQLEIEFLVDMGGYAKAMAGPAMAVAIAYALKASPLVIFSMLAVGNAANTLGGAGGPLAVFFIAIIATELGKLVSKQTKIDILVTPLVAIGSGVTLSVFTAPYIGEAASSIGEVIMWATDLQPFLMGIVVSVVVGMVLTLPISSAAICAALSLTGLAGGAAVAGCCAQMIGFAVMSFRDNGISGLFAQGIGTSMLQMPNIVRKPIVWLPPILASAVLGPVSSKVLGILCGPVGSGMGTSGLVGQIVTYQTMSAAGIGSGIILAEILIVHVAAPAVLTLLFASFMRKKGWIQPGDLKLDI